jgi:glutamate N-acetyltransferase/amino-acid N-acetyltransferase
MTNILKNIPRIETKLNQTLEIESQKEVSKMEGFARAIMTTDTRMKMIKAVIEFAKGKKDGSPSEISISGVAKGSGMIAPGMATMLSYIITDAGIRKKDAQSMLEKAVASSFNSITVDGDMSPDDSVIMLANGASNIQLTKENLPIFQNALNLVTAYLAREIIKDGEGATKIIQIQIQGAEDHTQAKKAALAIANSLLVKTAFFGEDANWGRILTALGYSGCSFTLSRVNLFFGKYQLCKNGQGVVFDETELKAYLKNKEINIFLKLGKGKGQAKVLTTDLSYDYVRINADYRS